MKTAEKIFGALIIISIVLKLLNISGNGILFTLSTLFLMSLYFYLGFAMFNDITFKGIFKQQSYKEISTLRIIGSIVAGIGLSILLTGILFRLQHWPGANFQLLIGLIFSGIILIIVLIKYLKEKSLFYKRVLSRLIIIGGFGLILFYISDYSIDKIRYRNYPDYVKALEDLEQNPDNREFRENADYEYNKIIFTK